jgi:hypothetical protein
MRENIFWRVSSICEGLIPLFAPVLAFAGLMVVFGVAL